jgi:hypothetical protein
VTRTGHQLLLRAYFNGGSALTELLDSVGRDTVESIKSAAGRGDVAGALAIVAAIPAR